MVGKHSKKYKVLAEKEQKKRFKMYKKKKHWVYSAILFLGTGSAIVLTSGNVQASEVNGTIEPSSDVSSEVVQNDTTSNQIPENTQTISEVEDAAQTESVQTTDSVASEEIQEPVLTDNESLIAEPVTEPSILPDNTPSADVITPAQESTTTPVEQANTLAASGTEQTSEQVVTEVGTATDLNDQFSDWEISNRYDLSGTGKFTASNKEYEVTLKTPASLTTVNPLIANTVKDITNGIDYTYSYNNGSGSTSRYYLVYNDGTTSVLETARYFDPNSKYYTSKDEVGNDMIAQVGIIGNYQLSEKVQITQDGRINHTVSLLNIGTDSITDLKGFGVSLDTSLNSNDAIPIISDGAGGIYIKSEDFTLFSSPTSTSTVLAGQYSFDQLVHYDKFVPVAGTELGTILKDNLDTNILYETPIATLLPNQSVTFSFSERILGNTKITEHFTDSEGNEISEDKVTSGQPEDTCKQGICLKLRHNTMLMEPSIWEITIGKCAHIQN